MPFMCFEFLTHCLCEAIPTKSPSKLQNVTTFWAIPNYGASSGQESVQQLYSQWLNQPTVPVPLVLLVQSAGTLYRTIWSHLTFLLIVLGSS